MIRKLPKKQKRSGRFRSQRHLNHVRSHACVVCDASAPIEVAHVRLGSGAGMGEFIRTSPARREIEAHRNG